MALLAVHTLVTVGDVKEEIFFMMFLCVRKSNYKRNKLIERERPRERERERECERARVRARERESVRERECERERV